MNKLPVAFNEVAMQEATLLMSGKGEDAYVQT